MVKFIEFSWQYHASFASIFFWLNFQFLSPTNNQGQLFSTAEINQPSSTICCHYQSNEHLYSISLAVSEGLNNSIQCSGNLKNKIKLLIYYSQISKSSNFKNVYEREVKH